MQLALRLQERSGPKLKDFVAEVAASGEVEQLRQRVMEFARAFPMP